MVWEALCWLWDLRCSGVILNKCLKRLSGFFVEFYYNLPSCLLGWVLGVFFQSPPFFAVGLILVASCPGGTASNVIAYLAKANVALSVTMTTVSTLAAIIMTPLLTSYLSGS